MLKDRSVIYVYVLEGCLPYGTENLYFMFQNLCLLPLILFCGLVRTINTIVLFKINRRYTFLNFHFHFVPGALTSVNDDTMFFFRGDKIITL